MRIMKRLRGVSNLIQTTIQILIGLSATVLVGVLLGSVVFGIIHELA